LQIASGRPRAPRRSGPVPRARARGQRYVLTRPKNRAKSEESAVARTEGVRRSDFPQKSRILQWFQWRKVFAGTMRDKSPIPPAGAHRALAARSGRGRPALRPSEGRPKPSFTLAPGHSPPPRAAPCCCPDSAMSRASHSRPPRMPPQGAHANGKDRARYFATGRKKPAGWLAHRPGLCREGARIVRSMRFFPPDRKQLSTMNNASTGAHTQF
jgi:hypothetical protein